MSKARILIVEDEGIIAQDIRSSLLEFGYNVCSTVATGEEAVRKAETERPDLALVDVVLQGDMDGIEAAHVIHSRFRVPIVYLTAYADEKMLERAKTTEPFGYLIKPFRDRELHSTIEMALFRHEMGVKLRENQEWLSVMLNSIADALIATDENGFVKLMNPVAELLTGWTADIANSRPLEAVFDLAPNGAETRPRSLAGELLGGDGLTDGRGHGLLTAKNGSQVDVEFNVAPIRDAESNIAGIVLVFRDVTERKRAEEKLRLLSEAIEQSSEGLAVVDLNGMLMFANKAFAALHGSTREQMAMKDVAQFHPPDQVPCVTQALLQVRSQGQSSAEIQHARADGTVFPGLMHNSVLLDREDKPVGVIVTLRDISDAKAAEEALRSKHEALELYSTSLEAKVQERTRDLENSRSELKRYSESLERTNEALKIIIQGIEEQKKEVEKKISHNLNLTVQPILDQMKSQELSETATFLLKSLEFNLANMLSSFGFNIVKSGHPLTPREIRISEMIRSGLSSKQIAKVMGISPQTVLVHRKNIRKKLVLSQSRQNLASFLKANL
ncbi:MAG: PAS domain S-box protein [Desulfomonilaceae bacterium]